MWSGKVLESAFELAAGGVDVAASGFAQIGGNACGDERVAEGFHGAPAAGVV